MVRFSTGTTSLSAAVVFASHANISAAADDTLFTQTYPHHVEAADAGILTPALGSSSSRKLVTASDLCGSAGYVDCDYGIVRGGTATCATACGAAGCCIGTDACLKFTGKVCKDGSCNGSKSCYKAVIPIVANSCKTGFGCAKVGGGVGGSVGNLVNSCNGDPSTPPAFTMACYKLAYKGTVGNVVNSCNCNGTTASVWCDLIGVNGGIVGNIEYSCNGAAQACQQMGYKGNVGDVKNSCNNGSLSCYRVGIDITVGGPGSIGSITNSCNANNACKNAGKTTSSISSNLRNCCNAANECLGANEAFIQSRQCVSTDSPSSMPTSSAPSLSPTTMLTTSTPSSTPSLSPITLTSAPTSSMPTTVTPTSTAAMTSPHAAVTLPFVGECPAQVSDVFSVHYEPGDRVSKGVIVFECKSWPLSLLCSQSAFNPPGDLLNSKSNGWKQAWEVVGQCTGTLGPPTDGCPGMWTSGDMAKYKANDQVSVIKSYSPLIQIIYKCKAWPYSWYCGQLSPLNHNGAVLGWEYVGECTGTIGPTSSPTFDPLTFVIAGCPDEYNLAASKKYVAGEKVSVAVVGSSSYKNVYVCREFPYSGYCSQSGFAPGEQYDYMAWTLLGPCDGTLAPTSAPTAYSGECTYTKMDTTSPTPTPVETPVGTWAAGTLYESGDQVRIGAKKFQCKPWPFYIWCRLAAYKPTLSETGLWTEAWTVAGECPAAV